MRTLSIPRSVFGRLLESMQAIGRAKAPPPNIAGAMLTDTGLVREANEDSVTFILPKPDMPGLAIVADGMGGHEAGEVASAIAVATICEIFYGSAGAVPRRLATAFAAAHAAIRAHAEKAPETAGMGTTCTALAFAEGRAFLAHIGDSRAYLVRQHSLRQISEDHSLVASLVRAGKLTPQDAARSADKNVILMALGIGAHIQPQIPREGIKLHPDDMLLLCSDGLSDLVPDQTILAGICAARTPQAACRNLVEAAKAAGGYDNISVGVFVADSAHSLQTDDELGDTREIRLNAEPG